MRIASAGAPHPRRIYMKRLPVMLAALSAMLLATPTVIAQEGALDGGNTLSTKLKGVNEVPLVSTPGQGKFVGRVVADDTAIEYELEYKDLQADITQAHIHLGKALTNGGIAVWLCGTDALPGPAGTPRCVGTRTGGASGRITAANVIGPAGQGIAPGEFAELLKNLRKGYGYANVHTTNSPGGEIRGQINKGGGGGSGEGN
jgi:hypothetical protein